MMSRTMLQNRRDTLAALRRAELLLIHYGESDELTPAQLARLIGLQPALNQVFRDFEIATSEEP